MSKFVTVLKVGGAIAGVVLAGTLLGWWASNRREPGPLPAPVAAVNSAEPAHSTAASPPVRKPPTQPPLIANAAATPQVAVGATNLITDWEDRLDQILGSDGEDSDKAKQLLEMFPRLPEAGQEEVAQHLSNLTDDKDYAPLGQYVTNSTLPAPVLDVLMQDLLNRPNSVKLPLLLDIAQQDQHPGASEAKDLLELFLEDNYGNDWNKWQQKLQLWLQQNPD